MTAFVFALAACSPAQPPVPPVTRAPAVMDGQPVAATPAVQSTPDAEAAIVRARFVDHTWRVTASGAVGAGTLYRFQSDGTLHVNAPGSTPGVGRWTFEHDALVMIEDGIAYPTDILVLDDHTFSIRSHNPGKPVDITMTKADDAVPPR